MATGGPIESVSIGGREYAVAGDSDVQRNLGGFVVDLAANGDGTAREIKTVNPWSLTGLTVVVDDDNGDQEFLQNVADRAGYEVITITYASGAVYEGTGKPSGEINYSNASTTTALELKGPQKLTKQ